MALKASKRAVAKKSAKKVMGAKKPLSYDPEYMRRRRLILNPDVYARIRIKSTHYLTVKQAEEVERIIDQMIGAVPRT